MIETFWDEDTKEFVEYETPQSMWARPVVEPPATETMERLQRQATEYVRYYWTDTDGTTYSGS